MICRICSRKYIPYTEGVSLTHGITPSAYLCPECMPSEYDRLDGMVENLLAENAMLSAPLSPTIQNHRIDRLVALIDRQYASLGEDIQTLASVCRRLANPPEEGDKGGGVIPTCGGNSEGA